MNDPLNSIRRIQYSRYGGPEEMRIESCQLPEPGRGEVAVRVKVAAINEIDWKIRQGYLKLLTGWRFPRGMGMDFSGIVEAVGPGVTRFGAGDKVLGMAPLRASGAFAEKVITFENQVVKMPDSLSFEDAAPLPTAGATAWCALVRRGHLRRGQKVFVNGARGGVGRRRSASPDPLAPRSPDASGPAIDLDAARAMGMELALNYKDPIPASIHHAYDIVLDCHGALPPEEGDALIRPDGVVLDINPNMAKRLRALFSRRRKIVFGSTKATILQKVVDLAASGQLRISIGRRASLGDGISLIARLEAGERAGGKAILVL